MKNLKREGKGSWVRMKQTLADLAIRLGLPRVVRVEKGGGGVRGSHSANNSCL